MSDGAGDPEIEAEAAYLAAARAALGRMYGEVVGTETPLSDVEDNDPIWENMVYLLARARRAQELVDLPEVPLFFGRIDHQAGITPERVYVGRRHVHDAEGRPMVVDWRAPVSTPFYRASRDNPQGVRLRRRYGFSDAAELTAYEDEPLDGAGEVAGNGPTSALVTAEIERPRAGPMRDIVATIQPEQDELVRAPLRPALCIQGAPGTGKTAVGLHRLAYLLYTERQQLARDGVVVVGPNRSFLTYIRRVLPALGEVDVTQTTIEGLLGDAPARVEEDPRVAAIKGDARMAAVLRRALWHHVQLPDEGILYVQGSYRYRVSAAKAAETVTALRGSMRYGAGRAALAQRLAHLVLRQMEARGAAPDDRDQAAVARSKPVKQLIDQVWPRLTPAQVLFRLLADPEFLAEVAEDELSPAEQELLRWAKPYRSWKSAKWSTADAVLLDELADLIERTSTLSHIVVDEAQDLSPMQCRALGRRGAGSLTVLGDLAQGTSPWAIGDWSTLLAHLGASEARLAVLDRGFRVPAQIIDYAARLLPQIAPELDRPTSVRRAPGSLRVTETSDTEFLAALVLAAREELKGDGSVALIAADAEAAAIHQRLRRDGLEAALLGALSGAGANRGAGAEATDLAYETEDAMEAARLVCVPAALAKGLEFDAVVVAEPARIVAAEPRGYHRLYVVLTRAVSRLHIVHAGPLPVALRTS